jgi:hypothetical protein
MPSITISADLLVRFIYRVISELGHGFKGNLFQSKRYDMEIKELPPAKLQNCTEELDSGKLLTTDSWLLKDYFSLQPEGIYLQ